MKDKGSIGGSNSGFKDDREGVEILLRLICYKLVTQHVIEIYEELYNGERKVSAEDLDYFIECYLIAQNQYLKRMLTTMVNGKKERAKPKIRILKNAGSFKKLIILHPKKD